MNSDNVSLPAPGGSGTGPVMCEAMLRSRLLSVVIPSLGEARTTRHLTGWVLAAGLDLYDGSYLYDGACGLIVVDGADRDGFRSLAAELSSFHGVGLQRAEG
jgi:hypothetical protein